VHIEEDDMAKRDDSTKRGGDKVMAEAKKVAAEAGDPWAGVGLAVEAARLDNVSRGK
jgi:hypothetical protein